MAKAIATWREQLRESAGGTTHTLLSDPVRPGESWYLARVSVKDATTAGAVVDVFITSGGVPHHVHRFAAGSLDIWSDYNVESWLREGEQVRIDFSAVVAADVLHAHLTGWQRLLSMEGW